MTVWVIHPRAEVDLDAIWNYTAETWGIAQAQAYLRQLRDAFECLCQRSELGRSINEVRPGLLRYTLGSHIIIFERDGDKVTIIRILHKRMDIPARLSST
jgi:toxin ParE1/3/4